MQYELLIGFLQVWYDTKKIISIHKVICDSVDIYTDEYIQILELMTLLGFKLELVECINSSFTNHPEREVPYMNCIITKYQLKWCKNCKTMIWDSDMLDVITLPQKYKVRVSKLQIYFKVFQLLLDFQEGIPKYITQSITEIDVYLDLNRENLLDWDMMQECFQIFPNLKNFGIINPSRLVKYEKLLTALSCQIKSDHNFCDEMQKDHVSTITLVMKENIGFKNTCLLQHSAFFLINIDFEWVWFSCSSLLIWFQDFKEWVFKDDYILINYLIPISVVECKVTQDVPIFVRDAITVIQLLSNDYLIFRN